MEVNLTNGSGAIVVSPPNDHAVVDICFVHGLGGGRVSTWEQRDVIWPHHLLAKDLSDARIITWGYDAEPVQFSSPTSGNRVKDHAKNLSHELGGMRNSTKTSKRPIIFVAHSLGGLICAKSLLDSSAVDPSDAEKLSDHVDALAFMGTPFEGSNMAKWANFLERLLKLVNVNVNKTLLDHLQTDSHDLKALGEEFPKWLNNRKVHVMCFYEEYPTKLCGFIVPRTSAEIAGHDAVSLPGNHADMCKFDNFEDPKYKTVLNTLRTWVDEIKAANSAKDPKPKPDLSPNTTFKDNSNIGGVQTGQDNSTGGHHFPNQTFNIGSKENK